MTELRMKKIVEKYSDVTKLKTEKVEFIPIESEDDMSNRFICYPKNEILLSDVKEGDVICRQNFSDRAVTKYTNKDSTVVTNRGTHTTSTERTFINKHVINK